MAADHDLLVIGGGPGGYAASIRAAQLGLNVGLIEKETVLGGTCLRIGCIPSKALLQSSELLAESRTTFSKHGIRFTDLRLDLQTMMNRKHQIIATLGKGIDFLIKKNRITRYLGVGNLLAPGKASVTMTSEKIDLVAQYIILATGSKPASLAGVQVDGMRIGTSTEALDYSEVPRKLIVIGAGAIGLELGSVWQRLGSKVVMIEYLDRILPGMDAEIANEALKLFQREGFEFHLKRKVKSGNCIGEECKVELDGGETFVSDRVLLAVGRVANTDDLGLKKAGLELDSKGRIPVNEHFCTALERVFAIGDVIRGPMLAHKAEEEGIACVERIVTGFGQVNYDVIPAVVYTQPEIASVGKTEEQLKADQIPYRKGIFSFQANGRAQASGKVEGKVKMLADQRTDRLLGIHIIGASASELIAEAAVALSFKASSEDLARTCHAHPSLAETIKEAALAVDQRSLHS